MHAENRTPWWWKLLVPHRRTLVWGLFATALCGIAASWVPFWSGKAVHALEQGAYAASRKMLLVMLVVTTVAGISRYLMRSILIGLSRTIERIQREELFDFLLARPFAFYERQRVGDLMSRIGDDVSAVRMATGPGLMSFLQTAAMLPVTVGLMLATSPRLGLAVLLPFSFMGLAFYVVGKFTHANQQKLQLVTSDLNTFSHETISGEKVVQAFGLEDHRVALFQELSRRQARLNIRQTVLYATYAPLVAVIGGIAVLVLVTYGGAMVLRKELSLGDLTAFSGYLVALAWPVMSLGWAANLFQRARAGQARIDAILRDPTSPLPALVPEPPRGAPATLRLEGVSTRFETGRGLGPLDLELAPGTSLAVVGSIGSGKSVLLQVLAGLRAPQQGRFLVDGAPLDDTTLRAHWAGLGWVPQEAFLFSTSLRENLTMAHPGATEADLLEAARAADLTALIPRLSHGLETVVGERGVILSGGERQRTALARALLRKPRLLLLDDALSAVDAETESRILANLKAYLGRTTLVMATHRIFVAELCEQVLVLEEGRMVQLGTPEELASVPGPYARLRRLQSLEQELMHA